MVAGPVWSGIGFKEGRGESVCMIQVKLSQGTTHVARVACL